MKRYLLLLLLLIPASASAHFLTTSGDVGAVLHMDPNDDPIALQQTLFYVELKQRSGQFNPQNCICSVTLSESGKTLLNQPFTPGFSFLFPEKGVYALEVAGKPLTDTPYAPFLLHWNIRVDRINAHTEAQAVQPAWLVWILSHGRHLLPIVAASGYVIYRTSTDKK